jgi:hypothetical protein
MHRIYKRNGGKPEFEDIRKYLLENEGIVDPKNDPNPGRILEEIAKKYSTDYRLHYKVVNVEGAKHAVNAGRVVVISF